MTRFAFILPVALLAALPAQAGNVTNQQTCQIMARHVVDIIESRDWKDEAAREIGILEAFELSMGEIITEEVADSAAQMGMSVDEVQAMVDQQGEMLTSTVAQRYSDNKLYRDYSVSLFNCAKMTPERLGSTPEDFVATLEQIGDWAQAGR